MRTSRRIRNGIITCCAAMGIATHAFAQSMPVRDGYRAGHRDDHGEPASDMSRGIPGARIDVLLSERMLYVIDGTDTLRRAQIAVASDAWLAFAGRTWHFVAPRGKRPVLAKRTEPVWRPPDWHYAETAHEYGLQLRKLAPEGATLRDGTRIVLRDSVVGLINPADTTFLPLPIDEHIVFDSTLFIPPLDTYNRQLQGALGRYALDLGDGFLLHGTRDGSSIGTASTHGCIRLTDADLEWVYEHVPVGAIVSIR